MHYFIYFVPVLLFICTFVGSGIYFTVLGLPNAFYKISPVTAIMPSIALAWLLHRGTTQEKIKEFLDGVRHRDIVTMCLVFLLAGILSETTKHIGSVDAVVHCALSFVPSKFLLIGLFLVAAFVSVSIGTSMGTIATVAPIAVALSQQVDLNLALAVATVVAGATFGDNLSLISDTTIASVMSQEADVKKKLKLNAKLASVASIITILILACSATSQTVPHVEPYRFILITPYILLITLAVSGFNVFVCLATTILYTGILGICTQDNYGILGFNQNINNGLTSMNEIMVLSLIIGGLSGLIGKRFIKKVVHEVSSWMFDQYAHPRLVQLLIAGLVSIFDILFANNVIAIVFTGEIAKELSRKYSIPAHYSATWLDIFSCVFQGIIPHGAQILLASAIAQVSPLEVVLHVHYCYILGAVSLFYILFNKIERCGEA